MTKCKSNPPTQPDRPAGPSNPPPPSGPKTAEVLHPVAELASLWRCSKDHIYDLIASGQLRATQLGSGRAKTRVPASAAAEYIASRSTKGRAA